MVCFTSLPLISLIAYTLATPSQGGIGSPGYGKSDWNLKSLKSFVVFGDSYTDESRLAYFGSHNGSAPPVGWVDPINNASSDGGYIWARYVSFYTGCNLYNYAVSGAVCSNAISPRTFLSSINFPFPAVQEYEIPAFEADAAYKESNGQPFLSLPVDETVYGIWIGTNDVGNAAFLTDSQVKGKTLVDYINCVYSALDKLYASGGRYFVLMNLIPLNLTPQYAPPDAGGLASTKFFQNKPPNITETSYRMMEQVVLINDVYKYQTPYETVIAQRYPGAHVALYDVWQLFTDMYNNPSEYLNGTAPLNVTGNINQCNSTGGNCHVQPSPDSYLWYDELHPSEQADRWVAKYFVDLVKGNGKYATYWS